MAPPDSPDPDVTSVDFDPISNIPPELLSIIAEFVQAANAHDTVAAFACSSPQVREAIKSTLGQYHNIKQSLGTSQSSENLPVSPEFSYSQ
jgi:hypothetical protein